MPSPRCTAAASQVRFARFAEAFLRSADAKSAAVRRDNALIVRDSVAEALEILLKFESTPESVSAWVAAKMCELRTLLEDPYKVRTVPTTV